MSNRRQFIQASTAGLITMTAQRASARASSRQGIGDGDAEFVQPLQEFDYGQIALQPGLHATQLEQSLSVLMSLDNDSLLRPFRRHAGLPTPGVDLGGWYSYQGGTFGQWLSVLARHYAMTGNAQTRDKVAQLVREFAKTTEPSGKIYEVGTEGPYQYSTIVRGLLDADRFVQSPGALEALVDARNAVMPHLHVPAAVNAQGGWTCRLPESQFLAWERTGDPIFKELALKNLAESYFEPLARGENVLPGRHAFTHVFALSSAAKAYTVLGDTRYLDAAKNGFRFLTEQSYATGAWGPNESFVPSATPWGGVAYGDQAPANWMPEIKTLAQSLKATHWHFESGCGSHAHMKLANYLLRITKDTQYGDSLERLMYNVTLGLNPLLDNGRSCFHVDYHSDGRKFYFDGYGLGILTEWTCESGSLPLAQTEYGLNAYFKDVTGVYVNFYIPSTLKWQQDGTHLTLTQTSTYPLGSHIEMRLDTSKAVTLAIRLRIPAWAQGASVAINGRRIRADVRPGTFLSLPREWRSGDRIELNLPMKVVLQPIDETEPNTVAVTYGPLVLFAVANETPQLTRQQLLTANRLNDTDSDWYVETSAGRTRFCPFWAIKYERYTTYLSVIEIPTGGEIDGSEQSR